MLPEQYRFHRDSLFPYKTTTDKCTQWHAPSKLWPTFALHACQRKMHAMDDGGVPKAELALPSVDYEANHTMPITTLLVTARSMPEFAPIAHVQPLN